MAYGPMSVGSDGTFNLLTDKTLTTEDVPADAKAVGDKFKMVYTKTETDGKLTALSARRMTRVQEAHLQTENFL